MMSKEQIKQWIKEKNMISVDDVQSALKDLFADTIQEVLEAEIESFLGYAKHDMKNKRTTMLQGSKIKFLPSIPKACPHAISKTICSSSMASKYHQRSYRM